MPIGPFLKARVPEGTYSGWMKVGFDLYASFGVKPTIHSVSPGSGPAGSLVHIDGNALAETGTQVYFGSSDPAEVLFRGYGELLVRVPTSAQTDAVKTTDVQGPRASNLTRWPAFPFKVTPRIDDVSPAAQVADGTIRIAGFTFSPLAAISPPGPATVVVRVGRTPITVESVSPSPQGDVVTAVVPPGVRSGVLTLTTTDGTATWDRVFTVLPKVSGVSPGAGPPGGHVTLSGTGLSEVRTVLFGDTPAAFALVPGAGIIERVALDAVVPPLPPGEVTVRVLSERGEASAPTPFTVLAPEAPRITAFTPAEGIADDQVTITMSRDEVVTTVYVGARAVPFVMRDPRTVVATVALASRLGDAPIAVVTQRGRVESEATFRVNARAPRLTSLLPTSGPRGAIMIVVGAGLRYAYAASMGFAHAELRPLIDEQLFVTVPVDALLGPNTVQVCVEIGGGQRSCVSSAQGAFNVTDGDGGVAQDGGAIVDAGIESDAGLIEDGGVTADGGSAPQPSFGPCTQSLEGVGTRDFEISFDFNINNPSQTMALVGQRACCVCSPLFMWTARHSADVGVAFEMLDGVHFEPIRTGPTTPGVQHSVTLRRVAGVLSTVVDGVPGATTLNSETDLWGAMPALAIGTHPCSGSDGTVSFAGTVTNVCIRHEAPRCPRVASAFESSTEGWFGDNNVAFEQRAGDVGGFLFVDPAESNTSHIYAPPLFRGDLTAFIGGTFAFDANMLGSGGVPWSNAGDDFGTVRLSGPGGSVTVDLVPGDVGEPQGVWTTYSVALSPEAWGASDAAFRAVLANVTALRLTTEALFGEESHGIDNIALTCP